MLVKPSNGISVISAFELLNRTQWGYQIASAVFALSMSYALICILKYGGITQLGSIVVAGVIIWYCINLKLKTNFNN